MHRHWKQNKASGEARKILFEVFGQSFLLRIGTLVQIFLRMSWEAVHLEQIFCSQLLGEITLLQLLQTLLKCMDKIK